MRDELVKAYNKAERKFTAAQKAMSAAYNALKYHDLLSTGLHNKIVRNSVYPHGIIVTDNMRFTSDGKLLRVSGTVLRPDGKPTVRIGSIWFPHSGPIEIADIQVMARMFYNDEPVFNFAFTSPVGETFTFVTTCGRNDTYIDGKCTFNGATVNSRATWEWV